jgi:hypothetical protein
MTKYLIALAAVLLALAFPFGAALAAPNNDTLPQAGPYEGIFYGMIQGDRESQAPIVIALKQRGEEISGTIYLGEGLFIDGGVCGKVNVPSTQQAARGINNATDPNRLQAKTTFNVSGFQLDASLNSLLSADGNTLTAIAKADLPWFCGTDPTLKANLQRYLAK